MSSLELIKVTVELQKSRKDLARADNALLVARAKLSTVVGKALGERGVDAWEVGQAMAESERQGAVTTV